MAATAWWTARRILILMGSLYCGGASGVSAQAATPAADPPARLILRLHTEKALQPAAQASAPAADARLAAVLAELHLAGVTLERVLGGDILIARLTPGTSPEQARTLSARLKTHPAVRYAEPDGRVRPAYVPTDPLRVDQWFQYDTYGIRAYEAWDVERGAAGVVMALLDTGILAHVDLNPARILPGYDFVSSTTYSNDGDGLDADPTDPGDAVIANECGAGEPAEDSSWHGLHLAGILQAETDNAIGMAGLNHASRLLPVRVLGKCGGSYVDIIDGILWAAGLPGSGATLQNPTPARVINLSFSAQQTCTAGIQDVIDRATAAGVVVIAAAGNNDGLDIANVLPAGCNNVIPVAATTRGGEIASYSNVGSRVLLSAPGGDRDSLNRVVDGIWSLGNTGTTSPDGDSYTEAPGTSQAAAQVTAAVSLLFSVQPALAPGDVRTILQQAVQAFPAGGCPATNCGAGILDMNAAVRMAQTFVPNNSSNSPTAATSGGGGGGGCSLRAPAPAASAVHDLTWLLVFIGLQVLRRMTTGQTIDQSGRPGRHSSPLRFPRQ